MATKTYDELCFTDDFMFCKVLENDPELCRELIEIILGVKIEIVEKVGKQTPIEITPDGRGVRLDVRLEGDGRIFNLEMQNAKKKELPRRSRYYQGLIDLDQLERGSKYSELKETFIIFLCTFDPFGQGLARYTVKSMIEEAPGIEYNDGTHKIYLSSLPDQEGSMSEGLRRFLNYMNDYSAEDDFTRRLETAVARAKSMESWRKEYMFLYEHEEEARAEGLEEGRAEGARDALLSLVRDGLITAEAAAERMDITEEEVQALLEEAKAEA